MNKPTSIETYWWGKEYRWIGGDKLFLTTAIERYSWLELLTGIRLKMEIDSTFIRVEIRRLFING